MYWEIAAASKRKFAPSKAQCAGSEEVGKKGINRRCFHPKLDAFLHRQRVFIFFKLYSIAKLLIRASVEYFTCLLLFNITVHNVDRMEPFRSGRDNLFAVWIRFSKERSACGPAAAGFPNTGRTWQLDSIPRRRQSRSPTVPNTRRSSLPRSYRQHLPMHTYGLMRRRQERKTVFS